MVDDHVAQRPDRIVEAPAVLDAEVLGHRDLHAGEVVAVPHRLEHRVREPQVEDLLEPHLPEEVVDPVDLGLVEVAVQIGRELARRLRGRGRTASRRRPAARSTRGSPWPGPRPPWRTATAGSRGRTPGCGGRRAPLRQSSVRLLVVEVALRRSAGVRRTGRTPASSRSSPVCSIDSRARPRSCSSVKSRRATPITGTSEQPAPLEPVQRAERQLPGQVAGDAEDDEGVGFAIAHRLATYRFRRPAPKMGGARALNIGSPPDARGGARP